MPGNAAAILRNSACRQHSKHRHTCIRQQIRVWQSHGCSNVFLTCVAVSSRHQKPRGMNHTGAKCRQLPCAPKSAPESIHSTPRSPSTAISLCTAAPCFGPRLPVLGPHLDVEACFGTRLDEVH
jgi:hypothetical protein